MGETWEEGKLGRPAWPHGEGAVAWGRGSGCQAELDSSAGRAGGGEAFELYSGLLPGGQCLERCLLFLRSVFHQPGWICLKSLSGFPDVFRMVFTLLWLTSPRSGLCLSFHCLSSLSPSKIFVGKTELLTPFVNAPLPQHAFSLF